MKKPLPVPVLAGKVHSWIAADCKEALVSQRQGVNYAIHEATEANRLRIEDRYLVLCSIILQERLRQVAGRADRAFAGPSPYETASASAVGPLRPLVITYQ